MVFYDVMLVLCVLFSVFCFIVGIFILFAGVCVVVQLRDLAILVVFPAVDHQYVV